MTAQVPSLRPDLLASTPLDRLRTIRAYANAVFDDENLAATWLGRSNRAVHGGLCSVGAGCQTPEGYREAAAELQRIERLSRAEAQNEIYPRRVASPAETARAPGRPAP